MSGKIKKGTEDIVDIVIVGMYKLTVKGNYCKLNISRIPVKGCYIYVVVNLFTTASMFQWKA